jgi:pilus assembly protein Flp/PilA
LREDEEVIDIAAGSLQHLFRYCCHCQRRTAMMKCKLINGPKSILTSFMSDESGQDLIEYALVAAIIALGATTAMGSLAGAISGAFTKITTSLNSSV